MRMDVPNIIYEDNQLLVLNKPAGLMVHGDGRTEDETLADWLVKNYPAMKEVGEPWKPTERSIIYRPGIVHRLDRDTSGVMIAAKTQEFFEYLKKQFQDRRVEKTYRAFVYGNIKEDAGVIDKPIAKSKKDFRMWSAQPGSRGRERDAVTEYKVLGRSENKKYCYVETYPKTGRTHQIRVHMKAIHHPLVCDPLYASSRECALGFQRLALHAYHLKLQLPNGEQKCFEAPLPDDFQGAEQFIIKNTPA